METADRGVASFSSREGEGVSAETVAIVHGSGGSNGVWRRQGETLLAQRGRTDADLPGLPLVSPEC